MTVCVATTCQLTIKEEQLGSVVIGVSDRMLTAGDIQFQPQQSKLHGLTNSIVAMVAGDMAIQTEILQAVQWDVNEQIRTVPGHWLGVRFAAEAYVRRYQEAKLRRAEHAILAPLGLSSQSFLEKQAQMAPELVGDIAKELLNFDDLGVEALVVGIDENGAHIFAIDDGRLSCEDAVGFAAIGVGHWHANSHLMVQGHTKSRPLPETMFLTYSAKRRAEVAPGVGEVTDMFLIGPAPGSATAVSTDLVTALKGMYDAMQTAIDQGTKKAMGEFNETVTGIIGKAIDRAKTAAPPEQASEKEIGTDAPKETT